VEQAISIDQSLKSADRYVYGTWVVYLALKAWIFWIPLFITIFFPILISRVYMALLPTPTIAIKRTVRRPLLQHTCQCVLSPRNDILPPMRGMMTRDIVPGDVRELQIRVAPPKHKGSWYVMMLAVRSIN
jgi:hypothetical protein